MKPDDETLLTAYLDGELDPDRRLEVETDLLSRPAFADHLRELAAVGDLVRGLPRPAPPHDAAPAVLSRIDRPGRPRLAGARAMAGVGVGIAAALVGVLSIAFLPGRARGPAVREVASVASAAPSAPGPARPRPDEGAARPPARTEHPGAVAGTARTPATTPAEVDGAEVDGAEGALQVQREQVRAMLDDPTLTRLFIVTDVIGGHAEKDVDDFIHRFSRTNPSYGRITITQGIVVDPKHPNRATVFALAMDEQELRSFQAKLNGSFPGTVESSVADPEVVTQLSDINQMAVLPGVDAVDLVSQEELSDPIALRTALRSRASDDLDHSNPDRLANLAPPGAHDGPASGTGTPPARSPNPAEVSSRPVGDDAGRAGAEGPDRLAAPKEERDRARRSRPAIVLVWVTTREP